MNDPMTILQADHREVKKLLTALGESEEEEAEIEHGLAREGLSRMMGMVAVPGFGAAAQMLLGGIEHHVEEEETEILPALKEALPRRDWLALGDAIATAKSANGQPVAQPKRRRSQKRKTNSKR